jgi:hypothetical protein
LHPADSIVMVEFPDVSKMVAAYEKAPMLAMLRDEEVRKHFFGVMEDTGVDLDEQISNALLEMGMPEAFAQAPMAGVRRYLEGIQAGSFSISLDRKGLDSFGARAAQMKKIDAQLDVIITAIEAYSGAEDSSAASLPADLAALGLAAAAITDPWSHPYDYSVAEDGSYILRSLGSDGKVGGSGDAADIDQAITQKTGEEFIDLLGFQGVIEFKNQAALDDLRGMLTSLITKSDVPTLRSGPFQMAGVQAELQEWSVPDSTMKFWLMRAQNVLVIGAGLATPEGYAARMADAAVKSAADKFYANLTKDFGSPTGAIIVQGSLRMADYAEAVRKMVASEGGDAEMLAMLDGMLPNASVRLQLVGERFVTEMTTKYVKPTGTVAAALGMSPLPRDLLSAVPDDAIGVYASSLDGPLMWSAFCDSMRGEEASNAQEQMAEFEQRYGFNIEHDLFGSLGNGMLMYLLPLKGVTSIPGMALVVDVKDPAALQRGIEGLMAMLNDEAGDSLSVKSRPYRDAPLWTFSFGKEDGNPDMNMLMNAFSPSISIVKNRLIVTLNSTHIKKEIKRALGEEAGLHVIATAERGPPADAVTFGYMDWASLIDGAYIGGRGLLGLMGGGGPLPIDASKLPEPSVFTHFFKPTTLYTRMIPDGTYMRNESSFGPETWGFLAGIVLFASVAGSADEGPMLDSDDEEMLEFEYEEMVELEPARDQAKPTSSEAVGTRESMRQLATAIAVYQMDTGKFPTQLSKLLSPTANYPSGFLKQGSLPKDGWGRDFVFESLDSGARYRLWSIGADGQDQKGAGDDLLSN